MEVLPRRQPRPAEVVGPAFGVTPPGRREVEEVAGGRLEEEKDMVCVCVRESVLTRGREDGWNGEADRALPRWCRGEKGREGPPLGWLQRPPAASSPPPHHTRPPPPLACSASPACTLPGIGAVWRRRRSRGKLNEEGGETHAFSLTFGLTPPPPSPFLSTSSLPCSLIHTQVRRPRPHHHHRPTHRRRRPRLRRRLGHGVRGV